MGYNARAVFHTNRGVSKERYYGCDDVGHIHALEVMAKRSVTAAAILYQISKSISNTAENEEEDVVEGLDVELSLKE